MWGDGSLSHTFGYFLHVHAKIETIESNLNKQIPRPIDSLFVYIRQARYLSHLYH